MRRFLPEMQAAANELDERHVVILSPRSFTLTGSEGDFVLVEGDDEGTPAEIQARHLRTIAESDFVRLVCPDGYVGSSASEELGYAHALDVPVFATEPPADDVIAEQVTVIASIDDKAIEEIQGRLGLLPPRTLAFKRLGRWAVDMSERRGFADETLDELLLLLTEEIAELVAAARPENSRFADIFDDLDEIGRRSKQSRGQAGVATSAAKATTSVAAELADVQIYLALIAAHTGHDLSQAVSDKAQADLRRHWQRRENR